jgi:hypothetical protein
MKEASSRNVQFISKLFPLTGKKQQTDLAVRIPYLGLLQITVSFLPGMLILILFQSYSYLILILF